MARILVVEDDPFLQEVIRSELERNGFQVVLARDGTAGIAMFALHDPDLVLLDLVLPDRTGYAVLQELRAQSTSVPIMMVTSRDGTEEKVASLDLGADDYIVKPFKPDELFARIRARLRRAVGPAADEAHNQVFRMGNAAVDLDARTVSVDGEPAHLTPTEFKLLEILIRKRGKAVRREALINALLGGEEATEQALQTHISRLRRKLGGEGERIKTVWGVGYRLDADDEGARR